MNDNPVKGKEKIFGLTHGVMLYGCSEVLYYWQKACTYKILNNACLGTHNLGCV